MGVDYPSSIVANSKFDCRRDPSIFFIRVLIQSPMFSVFDPQSKSFNQQSLLSKQNGNANADFFPLSSISLCTN
jgi:hypothetical protein